MSKIAGDINHHMMRNAKTRAINAPALDLIADILEQHTAGILAGVREHMDKRKSEARSAGFDAADMATAAAQGFRDGVASVSAGSDNGWLEAAVAWEVCASLHRQYCKGKDALFTTRQSDFVKHAENARGRASHGQAPAEVSPTAGMNIPQRILHVGGRNNDAGYVEFGSIQAVEALVRQVLRDLPAPAQPTQAQADKTRDTI